MPGTFEEMEMVVWMGNVLEEKSSLLMRRYFTSIGKKCFTKFSMEYGMISLYRMIAILLYVRTRVSSRAQTCGVDQNGGR